MNGRGGALVESYGRRKTGILGEKPVPVTSCSPQIPHVSDLGLRSGWAGDELHEQ